MHLDRKTQCPPKALFDVPHKANPMTAAQIAKRFPDFAAEMDGCGEERCLLYFWKRNKETKIYEFLDQDAEEEVAELFGVKIYDEEAEKEKYLQRSRQLTDEEIQAFKKDLLEASQEIKAFFANTTTSSSEEDSGEGSEEVEASEQHPSRTTP